MVVQLDRRPLKQREITFEDYLQMPEVEGRFEIIDGVFKMSPAPADPHQWDLANLYDLIKDHVKERRLGVVLFAPMDLIIRKLPKLTTRQPDLAYFSWESIGGRGLDALKAARRLGVAPDLAVEVLSPDHSRRKLEEKLADFAAIGIKEVWLASREAMSLEVLILENGTYVRSGIYGLGEQVLSHQLPDIHVQVDSVFVDD